MLKRSMVLLCALVVVVLSCIVPCSAAGSNAFGGVVYSALPFDYIRINNGEFRGQFVEWPYNNSAGACSVVTDYAMFNVNHTPENGGYGWISGDFVIYPCTSFSLVSCVSWIDYSSSMVISYYDSPSDLTFTRVRLSYNLIVVDEDDPSLFYRAEQVFVDYDSDRDGLLDSSSVDVIAYIREAYKRKTGKLLASGTEYVVEDFCVTIDVAYSSDPDAMPYLYVETHCDNDAKYRVFDWFNSLNLPERQNDADVPLDWLIDVCESFLRFEIFPGFALDTLLQLVIVIALVLVVLKVFT